MKKLLDEKLIELNSIIKTLPDDYSYLAELVDNRSSLTFGCDNKLVEKCQIETIIKATCKINKNIYIDSMRVDSQKLLVSFKNKSSVEVAFSIRFTYRKALNSYINLLDEPYKTIASIEYTTNFDQYRRPYDIDKYLESAIISIITNTCNTYSYTHEYIYTKDLCDIIMRELADRDFSLDDFIIDNEYSNTEIEIDHIVLFDRPINIKIKERCKQEIIIEH